MRPTLIAIAALVLVAGCGGGGGETTQGVGEIQVSGSSSEDLKIGVDLSAYLTRNLRPSQGGAARIEELCSGQQRQLREAQCEQVEALFPVYRSVRAIDVDDEVITIDTDLPADAKGHEGASILCEQIQGADVADFVSGHTIRGGDNRILLRCPTRAQLDSPAG